MNFSRIWLVFAAACLAAPSEAAPIPTRSPTSQGPISDALGLRDLLPATAPPVIVKAVLAREGTLEVQRRNVRQVAIAEKVVHTEYVSVTKQRIVQRGGIAVTEQYTESVPVQRESTVTRIMTVADDKIHKESVAAKDCKFFVVTPEGKLEAIEAQKAATQLKQLTTVLTGQCAEIDPRHLELIKPGTLYLVLPKPKPIAPPPPRPEEKGKT